MRGILYTVGNVIHNIIGLLAKNLIVEIKQTSADKRLLITRCDKGTNTVDHIVTLFPSEYRSVPRHQISMNRFKVSSFKEFNSSPFPPTNIKWTTTKSLYRPSNIATHSLIPSSLTRQPTNKNANIFLTQRNSRLLSNAFNQIYQNLQLKPNKKHTHHKLI